VNGIATGFLSHISPHSAPLIAISCKIGEILRILQAVSVATEMTCTPSKRIAEKKNATHLAFPSLKDLFNASNPARSGRLLPIRGLLLPLLWAVRSALLRASVLRATMRTVLQPMLHSAGAIQLLRTVRDALLRLHPRLLVGLLLRRADTDSGALRESVFRDHILRMPQWSNHPDLYQGYPERRSQTAAAINADRSRSWIDLTR